MVDSVVCVWEMSACGNMRVVPCLHVNLSSPSGRATADTHSSVCSRASAVFSYRGETRLSNESVQGVGSVDSLACFSHNLTLSSACPPTSSSALAASCHCHPASLLPCRCWSWWIEWLEEAPRTNGALEVFHLRQTPETSRKQIWLAAAPRGRPLLLLPALICARIC